MILVKGEKLATISDAAKSLGVNVKRMRGWLATEVLPAPPKVARGKGRVMVFSDEYLKRARTAIRSKRPANTLRRARQKNRKRGPALKIFVSYSHKDGHWLKELQISLTPLVRQDKLELWDDGRLPPGSIWKAEIEKALNASNSAILLVSRYFVASAFISEHELLPLLKAAKQRGLRVLWIAVAEALMDDTGIEEFQALNDPKRPLRSMPAYKRDKEWVDIAKKIKALI